MTAKLMESTPEYQRLKEYSVALESTRSDLWGVNEELRNKVIALELGQYDLQEQLSDAYNVLRRMRDHAAMHTSDRKQVAQFLDEKTRSRLQPPPSFL